MQSHTLRRWLLLKRNRSSLALPFAGNGDVFINFGPMPPNWHEFDVVALNLTGVKQARIPSVRRLDRTAIRERNNNILVIGRCSD